MTETITIDNSPAAADKPARAPKRLPASTVPATAPAEQPATAKPAAPAKPKLRPVPRGAKIDPGAVITLRVAENPKLAGNKNFP
jgi:hypothetical protein